MICKCYRIIPISIVYRFLSFVALRRINSFEFLRKIWWKGFDRRIVKNRYFSSSYRNEAPFSVGFRCRFFRQGQKCCKWRNTDDCVRDCSKSIFCFVLVVCIMLKGLNVHLSTRKPYLGKPNWYKVKGRKIRVFDKWPQPLVREGPFKIIIVVT